MRRVGIGMALVAGMAVATATAAQESGSRQSRDFVEATAGSDAFELAEAQSALAESKDPQTLSFARAIISDYERASASLRDAAARSGLQPPVMAIGSGLSPFLATLQSQWGTVFDRAYWQQQALAHRAALVTEQRYAATGDVKALRQIATEAIPIIKGRLAIAERMSAASNE